MEKDQMLPLGSIIKLKDNDNFLMIVGLKMLSDGIKYDYVGCVHPYGFLGPENLIMFNHDQIEAVVSLGYYDEESEEYYDDIMWLEGQNKEG